MLLSRKHRVVTLGLSVVLIAAIILAISAFAYPSPAMAQAICTPTGRFECRWDPSCSVQWSYWREDYCFLYQPWYEWVKLGCNCPT